MKSLNQKSKQTEQEGDDIEKWRSEIKHKSGNSVDTEDLWHKMSEHIEGNHL